MFNLLYQLLDLCRDDRIKHKAPDCKQHSQQHVKKRNDNPLAHAEELAYKLPHDKFQTIH